MKDKSYLLALNKAERDSRRLIQVVDDEEEDAELQSSLERARRMAVQERAREGVKEEEDDDVQAKTVDRHAKQIAELIRTAQRIEKKVKAEKIDEEEKEVVKKEKEPVVKMEDVNDEEVKVVVPTVKKEGEGPGIVFTTTTEFCRGLQNDEDDQEAKNQQEKLREQLKEEIERTQPEAMQYEEEEKKKERKRNCVRESKIKS